MSDATHDVAGRGFSVPVTHVSSRDNPLIKELRKLSQDSTAYRKQGRVWLEGDHLCRAALLRGQNLLWPCFQSHIGPQPNKNGYR